MNSILLTLCVIVPSVLPMSKQQAKNVCKYEKLITTEAKRNNLQPALLASLIYVESAFKPRVVSKSNACGLTQVIPKYTGGPETGYKEYSCEQLKSPRTSIIVGAKILGYMKRVYAKGNEDNALCMYAAGTICLKNKNLHKNLFYIKKVRRIYDTITDGC
jgi:soluble lytic murein transglycosylase-like protein